MPIVKPQLPVANPEGTDAEMLEGLRRATFDYFRNEVNPRTGLIADKTQPGSPSSIAAVGMALSVYVVAIERDLLSRAEAIDSAAGAETGLIRIHPDRVHSWGEGLRATGDDGR